MRTLYKKRREVLVRTAAASGWRVAGSDVGLHLLLPIGGRQEAAVLSAAKAAGIKLHGLSQYYLEPPPSPAPPALVLGYGGISSDGIRQGMAKFGEILQD